MDPTLSEQPAWAEDVLNGLDAGILLLDRHARVRYWNGWMERASDLPARAMLGHDLFDALPNLRESRLHTAVRDVLATGAPGVLSHTLNPMLFPLRLPDGRKMVHNVLIRPLPPGGEPRCLIQVTDVTASVNRERVLREQRDARYRAIVDTAPDAIITTDTRGTVQWMNGAAARQFDYRPDELIGRNVHTLLDEDSPDWVELSERGTLDGGGFERGGETVELTGRRRDGSRIDLELSMARWVSEGRSFITGILRDITERRRTRDELRATALAMRQLAEQTKATLDALPAFIAVLDPAGRIVSVNRAWAEAGPETEFLGQGSIVGDNYLDMCARGGAENPQGDAVLEGLRSLLSDGGLPLSAEYAGRGGASRHWFRCLAAPMTAGPFGGTVLMHIDVTEIKSMEAALRKLVGQKSTLLREVNHRVKNSLQLVSSLLTLQTLSLPDESARVHFQDARGRIEAIARVHNRLYQADQFQTIEFGTYLNELCEDLARASGGDILCDVTVRSDIVDLPIDQAAPLGLIANELVTNAIKHRGDAPARVAVTFRHEADGLVLTVSDQGPGLPANFDIRKGRSLGMRLITSLSGQIRAKVVIVPAERGTAFRIELPVPDPTPTLETLSAGEFEG